MVQSKGWDWENVIDTEYSVHLHPTEYGYYLAHKWKEAGYQSILDLGTGLGRHAICFAQSGLKVSAMDISEYGIQHLKSCAKVKHFFLMYGKHFFQSAVRSFF